MTIGADMFNFKERRARKAAERAAKAAEQAAQQRAASDAESARHRTAIEEELEEAKSFMGVDPATVPSCPLHAKPRERVFLSAEGAYLIEPRRQAGHWEGMSQGVSVHVPGTKSMRYRIGATKGRYIQGEELPTPIDKGTFVITDQRAVFIGVKQSREWLWSKLIGFTHATDHPWTAISVSNREKTSGVLYDTQTADRVRFLLDLAAARSEGSTDELVHGLQAELAALGPNTTDPTT
jgi:hypothetical protein